jgi:hypothetical protein
VAVAVASPDRPLRDAEMMPTPLNAPELAADLAAMIPM